MSADTLSHNVGWPAKAGLALAVLLRVLWPFGSSPTHVDEGGWPFSVRQWATDGLVTYDFHTAPGYHLVLGMVFKLAPPVMLTARLFSVCLSLVSLWLLWWAARRILEDERAAVWAALLWAVCFPANEIAGRALIEPMQLTWLLALLAALCLTGRGAFTLVAATTAGLLLTKANALVILPAFAAGAYLDLSPALTARHSEKLAGLGLGMLVAGLAYGGLYLSDPATFVLGWGATMTKATISSAAPFLRLGRLVLDPSVAQRLVEFLGSQTPLLFAFGLAGTARSLLRRQAFGVALWIALLLPFLLVQVFYSPQYFAMLYPALAIVAAALLAGVLPAEPGRWRWPALVVGLIVCDGLGRTAAALATLQAVERPGVTWMREHASEGTVLAAPYILMQLPNRGVSFYAFAETDYMPNSAGVTIGDWIAVDALEWSPRFEEVGRDSLAVNAYFAGCCELSFDDGVVRVYRVRRTRSDSR